MCPPLVSSSTVVVSDAASCMMAAVSSSCASAGPSEPTAPTQAQHVARWNDDKFQHRPGSEAHLTVTACASICCVCRVNVETLTWTSESGCGESRTHCVRVRCGAVGAVRYESGEGKGSGMV